MKASARKELADATVKWEEERLEMLQQQENVVCVCVCVCGVCVCVCVCVCCVHRYGTLYSM